MKNKLKLTTLILVAFLLFSTTAVYSQVESGRSAIGAIFNGTKYWGELTDNQIWIGGEGFFRWNIFKYLSLHGTFGFNQYRIKIDQEALNQYPVYFNMLYPIGEDGVRRTSKGESLPDFYLNRVVTGDITAAVHLIPSQMVVPYLFAGIGVINASPLKGKTGSEKGTPNIWDDVKQEERVPKTGISFPVGLGFEFYLTDDLVMNFKGTYRFLTSDYIDDIPDDNGKGGYGWNLETPENQTLAERERPGMKGADKLLTFGGGFSYYVFGESDYDKDGLSNSMERTLGTDPWSPDTDGDGLRDGEEYYTYHTSPLKADTDDDSINDYDEVITYKTNPNLADTDKDGLTDYDEIFKYKTDPLRADSDNDRLSDGEEVNTYKTNPLNMDSDSDGLTDYDEIFVHKTNPLNADSDGDGLTDYDEITTYKTDPNVKDTDGDGLTDGDEVNKHKTNPLEVDTDNDGLTDGDEVNKYKTNPLNKDTDGDGLSDGEEINNYKTNPLKVDTDGDGIDDNKEINTTKTDPLNPDTDGDTVADGKDDCPLVKGIPSDEPGMNGCPPVIKIGTKMDFPDILFKIGKDEFNFEEAGTALNLAKLLQYVNQCDNLQVRIEGHSSSEGNAKTNQTLSEKRAKKVVDWLILQGVTPSKILGAIGYGSSQLKVAEPSAKDAKKMKKDELEAIRKQNRRISVEIIRTCGD